MGQDAPDWKHAMENEFRQAQSTSVKMTEVENQCKTAEEPLGWGDRMGVGGWDRSRCRLFQLIAKK